MKIKKNNVIFSLYNYKPKIDANDSICQVGNKVIITHRYSQRSSSAISRRDEKWIYRIFCFTHQQNTPSNPDNFRFNDLTSPLSFPISKDFPETNFFSRPIFSLKFNKILKYRERDRQFHPSSFLILHPLCTYSNLSLSLSLGSIKRFQRTKLDNSLLDGRPRVFLDGRGGEGGGGGGLFRNGSMHVVRWRGAYRVTRHTTRITRIPP